MKNFSFSFFFHIVGLGSTVPELGVADHGIPVFDKTDFSMCLPPVKEIIKDKEVCLKIAFYILLIYSRLHVT